MGNQTQSYLNNLQKVSAKVGHEQQGRTGIKSRIWSYKKMKKKRKTLVKLEDFKVLATLCGIEFATKTSATSARFKMSQDGPESKGKHVNRMTTGLQKSQKMGNQTPPKPRPEWPPKCCCKSWT